MRQNFNITQVAKISYEQLESVYKYDFPTSAEYRELVLRLHDNVIEFNFLSQAGLISTEITS